MSEFLERKGRTYFRRLDYNNDGFLTYEDFELMAERFGSHADEERQKTVKEQMTKLFGIYEAASGVKGRISEQQFVDAFKGLSTNPEIATTLKEVAVICFSLFDTDADGVVHEPETVKLFRDMRISDPESNAKKAFEVVDTNHDGKISFEEASAAFSDFFLSEDESRPGNSFFGPLI